MPIPGVSLKAGGNILPARFIVVSGAFTGTQAGSNVDTFGISDRALNLPPVYGLISPSYVAISGQNLPYKGDGEETWLTAGEPIAAGAELVSDADGKGITADSDTGVQHIGAIALSAATAEDELIRVRVRRYDIPSTATVAASSSSGA